MAVRIDGKAVALEVREQVKVRAAEFAARHGRAVGLHVVLVGDDPGSAVYVRNKELAAEAAGIAGEVHRLPADTSEATLLALVRKLNDRDDVDGILVQFPVPQQISQGRVLETISPDKDVDGLHAVSAGRLWSGLPGLVSCTPAGCMRLLEKTGVPLRGARAIVLGRSNLVGKPIAALLLAADCTVTLAHSRTVDLPARCREADIVIAAVGRPRLVGADWIRPGACVIDVGINRLPDGKIVGDVDYAAVEPIAGFITPVPGGVGPMTIAMLLENTVKAAEARVAAQVR
ncbi:MAG TPA: bifunctional methylenetetrahydrofolate dehydrogenase/methenyltetrahydrofolate cyclohydrolase FolD [Polyangiaceae bacterium]|nr:bifunctional methylenetetrahydrofolate dehydrogenase/methenyltetrahydrofolate cyclohydrolase FolD [Polyangiaceae bacterium]